MMNIEVMVTGVIGALGTLIAGWVGWFFTRKKYNTEVDYNELENLKKSLEVYQVIVSDNVKQLKAYIKIIEENRVELYMLKQAVTAILDTACLDTACLDRKFYSEDQIKNILQIKTKQNEATS